MKDKVGFMAVNIFPGSSEVSFIRENTTRRYTRSKLPEHVVNTVHRMSNRGTHTCSIIADQDSTQVIVYNK